METLTKENRKACIIWMHGLGADASDMAGLAEQLILPQENIEHIFLDAPLRAVTLNQGMVMPAWYDIYGLSILDREDRAGIEESADQITHAIQLQRQKGYTAQQIFLAGFSQGGAMALYTAIRSDLPLAGVIVLSAYLPLSNQCQPLLPQNTPVFLAYGKFDLVVQPKWSEYTREWLEKNGYYQMVSKTYPMQHTICHEEIADLSSWLTTHIEGMSE